MTENVRWLDVDAASRYVSMRADIFLRAVASGKLPKPYHAAGSRSPRWDRDAIDACFIGTDKRETVREAVNGVVAQIKAEGAARRQARSV